MVIRCELSTQLPYSYQLLRTKPIYPVIFRGQECRHPGPGCVFSLGGSNHPQDLQDTCLDRGTGTIIVLQQSDADYLGALSFDLPRGRVRAAGTGHFRRLVHAIEPRSTRARLWFLSTPIQLALNALDA